MRATCCICSDLFENNDSVNIAAAPCGHTFHEVCLMKWLATSGTCPSCRKPCGRKQVIHKLFFDGGEVNENIQEEEDPSKLVNEVSNLRSTVRQREKEKSELVASENSLKSRVVDIQVEKETLEKKLKKEKNTNTSLVKQISNYEAQQTYLRTEKEEYRKAMKTLKDLQHLQVMLSGSESDALQILSQNGEGCTKQLSRYCAILKREYEQSKNEKKTFKDQIDKLRRELVTKDRLMKDKIDLNVVLTEQLSHSEEDLKKAEKERDTLRDKLRHLRKAVRSPGETMASSSFIETLTAESPMNGGALTPRRAENVANTSWEGMVPMTPDLFDSPTTQTKTNCAENGVKFVRISSASDTMRAKRQRVETKEINDFRALGSLNIFKKKSGVGNFSSTIQKGYDGLGGHMTFTKPLGNQVARPQLAKKRKPATLGSKMFAKNPPLPSLDNFIEIDIE